MPAGQSSEVRTLMTGVALGESPRWHVGRLWFCDWGAEEIVAVDVEGSSETLFLMANEWGGPASMGEEEATGRVLTVQAPAAGAGWP
ncbi:MAG TPA: hypothetical protein VI122_12980 [Thermoleophilaceae bacterium]